MLLTSVDKEILAVSSLKWSLQTGVYAALNATSHADVSSALTCILMHVATLPFADCVSSLNQLNWTSVLERWILLETCLWKCLIFWLSANAILLQMQFLKTCWVKSQRHDLFVSQDITIMFAYRKIFVLENKTTIRNGFVLRLNQISFWLQISVSDTILHSRWESTAWGAAVHLLHTRVICICVRADSAVAGREIIWSFWTTNRAFELCAYNSRRERSIQWFCWS